MAGGPGGDSAASGARGQTTFDFAIGMSIFLLSLAFVLAFVPGMFDPFTTGTQEETVAVNRAADDLAQRLLGSAERPNVLDRRCTRKFFGTLGSEVSSCAFTGTTVVERLGLKPWRSANITVVGNRSASDGEAILCWNGDSYIERDEGSCAVTLAAGTDPALASDPTVSATRVALLDGRDVTIEVEVW